MPLLYGINRTGQTAAEHLFFHCFMKLNSAFFLAVIGFFLTGQMIFAAENVSSNSVLATPAVYVPDMSHQNDPLPTNILVWDSVSQETNVAATAATADFVFSFTNISPDNLVILSARGMCHCTVAKIPSSPWTIPPGSNGQIEASVDLNIAGRMGTLFKSVTVSTDKGYKTLMLKVIIQPVVFANLSEVERARGIMMAKVDRQAIFKNDCITCHVKPGEGKYGQTLYDAVCGVCHEAEHRATMVPDLHNLKTPTNEDFWQTWIAHGKPGSLMPAFSTADGGPLNDVQIASLARYLNTAIPSHVSPAPQ
jgi:cytochrome c553